MAEQAVLDAAPEIGATKSGLQGASNRREARCAECGEPFARRQASQLFCCVGHKRSFNNRWLKRGAVLAPLYAAARTTRGGSRGDKATGVRARADADHLVQRWKDEDAEAGRMSAVAYIAFRYRLGLVEVA